MKMLIRLRKSSGFVIPFLRRRFSNDVTKKEVVFSGIQPTGIIHLGNYLGAVKRWKELQDDPNKKCIFAIVDLHAITLPQKPDLLREEIRTMTATLLACGLDETQSILFQQSDILEHTQLGWIMGCLSTMPKLSGLPQFKEKSTTFKEIPVGLFTYPLLQTADILLYKATQVPIGDDNLQQIHLAQHLTKKFNSSFGKLFPFPQPLIYRDNRGSRIRSLRHPDKKMSKSEDQKGRIQLLDAPEVIVNKLKKAMTDFTSEVTYDPTNRPGVSNMIMIHSIVSGKEPDQIVQESSGITTAQYKLLVADELIQYLKPIQERYHQLSQDRNRIDCILEEGAERARTIASQTMKEVKSLVGLK